MADTIAQRIMDGALLACIFACKAGAAVFFV